jgi:Rrf2 family protein
MMLDVARNGGEDVPVSLTETARRTGLSRGYLEHLAQALRNARLIRGRAGRYGGYQLAEATTSITVGQIIEATIGPVCIVDCVDDPEGCPRSDYCECRVVYNLINDRIDEVLQEFTLADLLDPKWLLRHGATRSLPISELETYPAAGCSWDRRGKEVHQKETPKKGFREESKSW